MLKGLLIIENIPLGSNFPFFNICKHKSISLDFSSITPFNFDLVFTLLPKAKLYIFFFVHSEFKEREQQ